MGATHVAKRRPRALGEGNQRVASRATPFARGIQRALVRWGRSEFRRLQRSGKFRIEKAAIAKASDDDLRRELEALFRKFGLMQLDQAGRRGASMGGGTWEVTPDIIATAAESHQSKVVLLIDETRQRVRGSLDMIVRQSLRETPRPTAQELGRRIARSWFGPGGLSGDIGRGTARERELTADWRRRDDGGPRPGEQEYLFSFDRAATVARTELGQIENMGIADGLTQAGVAKVKWLAHANDGRSVGRRHYLMNLHKAITVEAMNGSDRSKWFELPSGIRAPYPNWPGLPAGETVNCRCVVIPA